MKIIHVTDELQPEAGGLVSVPINLAAAQAALGHEVVLIGRTGGDRLLASNETRKISYFDKVRLVDCGQPGFTAKLAPFKCYSQLKQYVSAGAVVHLHGVWDPILLLASRIAQRANATYIVTPHSMLHPWQMKRFVWQKQIVFAIGWRKMFNAAAFIHTLSIDEKKHVEAFNFGTPTEIIPNGIYAESMAPVEPNVFLEKFPELKDVPYILFLSRLHYQKGIIYLLDGFEELAKTDVDVRLVLAGPDYGELRVINEKLSHMESAGRVLLPGPLYGDEKMGALHGASCFALTSLNEGFSVAILEALACGLPVVISKNCSFPEVEISNAGIIAELDRMSIAQALSSVLNNPQEKMHMGNNAKRLVLQNYHWNTIAKQTEALYEKYSHL